MNEEERKQLLMDKCYEHGANKERERILKIIDSIDSKGYSVPTSINLFKNNLKNKIKKVRK